MIVFGCWRKEIQRLNSFMINCANVIKHRYNFHIEAYYLIVISIFLVLIRLRHWRLVSDVEDCNLWRNLSLLQSVVRNDKTKNNIPTQLTLRNSEAIEHYVQRGWHGTLSVASTTNLTPASFHSSRGFLKNVGFNNEYRYQIRE